MSGNNDMVSIIIPVFNQWNFTDMCLESIKKNTTGIEYEVIVVDDCSTDETYERLSVNPEVVYLRNAQNEGFIKGCNRGANHAKGNIYLFLNNDTEVQNGWLSAIVDTFQKHADAGIVGSKLLSSDGLLQEAGGIVWSDASAWNYGRGKDPSDWQYNFIREVDYVSGACLAIRKEVWEKCNGFDEIFMPAYYEDTDLCFSTRKHGYKVYYQPRSVVIHHEGVTSGKDITVGVKKYQVANQKKFYEKWQPVLESKHWHFDSALAVRAKWHDQRPMILVVDFQVPEQDKDSGSVRMLNIILLLIKMGFRVTIFPDSKPDSHYAQYFMDLGVEVVEKFQYFEEFITERTLQFDIVWLARPSVSFDKLDVVRKYLPSAKVVYDTVDLHFVRTQRQSEIEQNANLTMKAKLYLEVELYLSRFADLPVVVTDVEKKALDVIDRKIDPIIIPNIHQLPHFKSVSFEERNGLMFLGGYKHPPNVDAVLWFVTDVLPLIWKKKSDVVFYVLGSHPPEEIMELQKYGEIEVIGWVDNLEPWFNKSRVFVSPLRYGAGMKGKNGQAMSYGLPLVTTSIGAEGMNLVHRKNAMICDSPEDFAKSVIELYSSPVLWQEISVSSIEHIKQSYSPIQAEIQLEQLCLRLFGSNVVTDYVRPDIQKLTKQLAHKNKIMKLKKDYMLYMLKHISNRPMFIWGAGSGGILGLAMLHDIGFDVKGFIDSNPLKHGEIIKSITIYSPDVLKSNYTNKPFVVIASIHHKEIEVQLKTLGFDTELDYLVNHFL